MCGIAGAFNYRSFAPVQPGTVERMTRLLAHRGPNGEGYLLEQAIGLGHVRLSILDLSERGRNPMFTPDGRYAIVYNGEVYNYLELREELIAAGTTFRTDTDTEVVLALFARMGPACLDRLNGMFAFAIWDRVERSLFLARDRAGIKPLYYAETADGFIFASEAKSLLAHPGFACDVDPAAIDVYLTFGYTPGEGTMFKGIHKLLPGWAMRVNAQGVKRWQYWDVTFAPATERSAAQTAEELRELLRDATRICMRSDVPVGVFLSGGLDSSATVALLAQQGFENLQTFSVAYRGDGDRYDESGYAKLVADRFHTAHHVLYVDPKEFGDFIPDYVWHMDEPVTEAAAISLYFIARLLREHVTVALSGEGADEIFAGYSIYRYMGWLEHYHRLPRAARAIAEPLLSRFGGHKLGKYARLGSKPLAERYLGVHQFEPLGARLYTDDLAAVAAANRDNHPLSALYARMRSHDPLSQMLYADFKTWLVDDLLVKADKMTMANSVELRVPFLDHRVVEYGATIPSSMKQRGGDVKWIMKRALEGVVPQEILARKKVGFPTPIGPMFRGPLSEYVCDTLVSARCTSRGYFKPAAVRALVDSHRSGREDAQDALWRLLVLEEWHRQFPDRMHQEPARAGHAGPAAVAVGR